MTSTKTETPTHKDPPTHGLEALQLLALSEFLAMMATGELSPSSRELRAAGMLAECCAFSLLDYGTERFRRDRTSKATSILKGSPFKAANPWQDGGGQ